MYIDKTTGEVISINNASHVIHSSRSDFYQKQANLDKIRADKLYRERHVEHSNAKFLLSFLYVGFALLLFIAIYRVASGMPPLTFTGFLEGISNVPNVTLDLTGSLTIQADWGVFNFLRDFINIFAGGLSVTLFVATLLIQILLFIVYLLGFFFGIV